MDFNNSFVKPIKCYGKTQGFFHIIREILSHFVKIQFVYRETNETFKRNSLRERKIISSKEDVYKLKELDQYCPDWRERLSAGNNIGSY
jgi:hypothetical protein